MKAYSMTESEITRRAIAYMGQPAWVTVVMAIAALVVYAFIFTACVNGFMPLWLGFILTSYLIYVIYTPLHEAAHTNISGRHTQLRWLNHCVGYLSASLLGVSYTMHRAAHLAHHRATNVMGEDPDFVTDGDSFYDIITCGSKMVVGEYRDYFERFYPHASSGEKLAVALEIIGFIGWRIALAMAGLSTEVLVLAVFANIAGVTLLGYIFAWIVHTPFNKTARYEDTATIILPDWLHRPVTTLWLWQNFHSIHHLYPKVPFYQYEKLFNQIRPGMEERGAPIFEK